jgi:hypothetical protein
MAPEDPWYERPVGWFSAVADHRNPRSLASRFRRRRHALLRRLLAGLPRPLRLLDVGGTEGYWRAVAPEGAGLEGITITLLNTELPAALQGGFEAIAGDARDLGAFADRSFDVVFSNSVIEHVGDARDQRRMADEVRRVGRAYYVQTPNRWFPIEPHFLVPGYQFLPVAVRTRMLQRFRLGWMPRTPDAEAARRIVESVQLLDAGQLRTLFPEATLHRERIGGLTKSLIATHGFAG